MGSIDKPEWQRKVDSVCIIGAGPSGLAAAKYLSEEKVFSKIVIYEQRGNVGGLWNYLPLAKGSPSGTSIPQTDPYYGAPSGDGESDDVVSPVYDLLETNIPRGLMGFSDLPWPDDCQLFPNHQTVLEYLEHYAEDIRHLVEFDTTVVDVRPSGPHGWIVKSRRRSDGEATQFFDAVLVASGHFDVPYIPAVDGIKAWSNAYPGSILHSKQYRNPAQFDNQKVIVVGNSASGVDIGAQISTCCKQPLLQSVKDPPEPATTSTNAQIINKPAISKYILDSRAVRFEDGTTEEDVNAVVYCTGYFYSYPFLRSLDPPVISTGECVENLYQHIFYRSQPTLAFAALNQKIIPFPVAEAQAAAIARVWAGRLELPDEGEMREWEERTKERTKEETGGRRNFHVLKYPMDADYINMLHDWAMSADHKTHVPDELRRRRMSSTQDSSGDCAEGTKGTGKGKEPPYWGEKEYWTRERFPAIKQAFQSFGEERHSKRTLEDVGFSFDDWKRERTSEAKRLL